MITSSHPVKEEVMDRALLARYPNLDVPVSIILIRVTSRTFTDREAILSKVGALSGLS
jgi:hypothetical protein